MIAQPAVLTLSHDFTREDLFSVVFVLVDDWMKKAYGSSNLPRETQMPEFTDSEVLTIVLVGELCHAPREKGWLRQVRASYLHLFPLLPERSRFCRRAQKIVPLLLAFRRLVLHWADADLKVIRLLDSLPLPLCANWRVHQSAQPISGTAWGYCSSKKSFYFGLHPLGLVTEEGFVDELFLAPGDMVDSPLLNAFLSQCERLGKDVSGQEWVGDKGFVSKARESWAKAFLGLTLQIRQRDYKDFTPSFQKLLDKVRRPIEGLFSVLTDCFHLTDMLVKTDLGIYRRVEAKVAAFNLARYFNLVLGRELSEVARYAV
ncbi:IS982 family transposase [Armatimonas sp.]|uniref:IS982 family transposase n=1 Tax=Armatimonas sp. TaxID=1872638 RepID=UPI00286CA8E7|nr:IS982 family transposase [Armatimonas sp.]